MHCKRKHFFFRILKEIIEKERAQMDQEEHLYNDLDMTEHVFAGTR